jgi:hypothetical protein
LLICRDGKSNPGMGLRQINPPGKSLRIIRNESQAPKSKIFLFSLDPNQFTDSRRLVPPEGRSRVVTSAGRDAVDAAASGERMQAGRMMLMRTAKSCRSDAPGLASSLREDAQATVATKPGHRGEREVRRKTIAQGEPD